MTTLWPPEEPDMQTIDLERWLPFQFLTSLLLVRRGWFANRALHLTRRERRGWQSLRSVRRVAESLDH